jgi:hypothetical protein
MAEHIATSPADLELGDIILVEQQKREIRTIAQVGSTYEITYYNWPVRPDPIPGSLVVEEDGTVTLVVEDEPADDDEDDDE